MRFSFAIAAAATLFAVVAPAVRAQDVITPLYSFESGTVNPDGFVANGGGLTVSADTIGKTEGDTSLKASVVGGATFVGALTANVVPDLGDPPGIDYILFDMTIAPGQEFTGSFALVGVTVFSASQPGPGQQFGLPVQFADFEHIGGKAPGTYEVRIDLSSATHPMTFATGQSFNQIFGTVGSGPDDMIPTGFQLFLNKSNDAPLTVYFDNIRAGSTVPEPGSMVALLAVGALALRRRRAV